MPSVESPLIQIAVTPRFEVFYALQALQSSASEHLQGWRREMQRRLTPRIGSSLVRVAPSPLIWPLLADAFRDTQPAPGFTGMMADLKEMKDKTFQRAVLGGVFKTPGTVDKLLARKSTVAAAVRTEEKNQERLLTLLGLLPFSARSASALAFGRLVNEPTEYREEVVNLVVSFWGAGFAETWATLEPQMRDRARALQQALTRDGPAEFARALALPVSIAGDEIRGVRGTTRVATSDVAGIHVIPSAFNTAGLWAVYGDESGKTRFYIPLLDTTLSPDTRVSVNPALVFSALGDTTRYAMASTIARSPMTSVELARAFGVSKPTISHHVQLLRAAGLLEETHTENGTLLALNRRVLNRSSGAAAREMFSGDNLSRTIKRTRKPNKL